MRWIKQTENKDKTSEHLNKMEYGHIEFVRNSKGIFLEIQIWENINF